MRGRLGKRIRQLRTARGLGVREMSTLIDVSATYLSRIETSAEQSPPTEDVLRRIARVLDADCDELMRLAGRVSAESVRTILADPQMPAFLRLVRERGLSADALMRLVEAAR